MIKNTFTSLSLAVAFFSASAQQTANEQIRLNQVGFYPDAPKKAVVVNSEATEFFVVSKDLKDTVYRGKLENGGKWELSEEQVKRADFSKVSKPGTYVLVVQGLGNSYPFDIAPQIHYAPGRASVRGFYYQRVSTDLPEKYAGKWARKAGHPDTAVIVHNSAAGPKRKAGDKISSPLGWYDAGDYNKYIVNSGITTATLLSLYEDYPAYFDTLSLNIPESGNQVPDLLDETLWNLRWMLTMQDPDDGGVYHKLTNATFNGFLMPKMTRGPRYVVKKGTAASLDFAAVMAQGARIFKKFPKALPGLADTCLAAAKAAYVWAKKNPDVPYVQSELKDPQVLTGAYDDSDFSDEFQWAALELFVTTGNEQYYKDANLSSTLANAFSVPAWPKVNTLGLYSLARNKEKFKGKKGKANVEVVTEKIVKMAEPYKKNAAKSPYNVPMGLNESDFVWGSNSVAANQGILLLYAYQITKDEAYLYAALANLDYLMGRNATGFSFLTGYGDKTPMHPHHRPSQADRVDAPVPGLLAGGPNPKQEDMPHCKRYKEQHQYPATSYIDEHCSYASNEIAINWNAPYAYLALAIEANMANQKK